MTKYKGYFIKKHIENDEGNKLAIYSIYKDNEWVIDYPSLSLAKEFITVCKEKGYDAALRIVG